MKKILFLLICFSLSTTLFAENPVLSFGQTVRGSLSPNEVISYEFEGHAGSEIRIGHALWDTYMTAHLLDPQNQQILTLEGNSYNDITLLEDGVYKIELRSIDTRSWSYKLWLYEKPFVDKRETINYGVEVKDTIAPFYENCLEFRAEANAKIRLHYSVWSEYFSTVLYTPSGDELMVLDGRNKTVEVDLPERGLYKIKIASNSKENWQYTIYLNKIFPINDAREIKQSEIVSNTFTKGYVFDRYKFLAQKDDTIQIRLFHSSSTIIPRFDVIDTDGNVENFSGPKNEELSGSIIIPKTGYYGIIVPSATYIYQTEYSLSVRNNRFVENIISYDQWADIAMFPGETFSGRVFIPEVEQLFVFIKKEDRIGYSDSWDGKLKLYYEGNTYYESSNRIFANRDINAQIDNPESGIFTLDIFNYDDRNTSNGKILFTSTPPELILNRWDEGEVLRPYGEDWKMVEITEEVDALNVKTEGFGKWSEIEVFYESINQHDNYWKFDNWGQGYQITGKIDNPQQGRYYIKYMDSAVLYGDASADEELQKRKYLIFAGTNATIPSTPQPLSIESLSRYWVQKGIVSIACEGTGFAEDDIIKLVYEDTEIIGKTFFKDARNTSATFDLVGEVMGDYQFLIENKNGEIVDAPKPVRVIFGYDINIGLDVLTRDKYRAGRFQPLVVRITNNSGIDLRSLPVTLTIPNSVEVSMDNLMEIEYDEENDLVNPNEMKLGIPNKLNDSKQDVVIIIPSLPPSCTYELEFKLKPTVQEDFQAEVVVGSSLWEFLSALAVTPLKSTCSSCTDACMNTAVGLATEGIKAATSLDDLAGCANGVGQLAGQGINSYSSGNNGFFDNNFVSVSQFSSGVGNTVTSCLLAAGKNVPWIKAVNVGTSIAGFLYSSADAFECGSCIGDALADWIADLFGVGSSTPEDKYGPTGAEVAINDSISHHYIDTSKVFEYKIDYWNKEDATAPAAIVYIRDTLDTDFDISTLNFTEVGFMRWKMPLEGGQYFNVNVDCRPDMPYIVNVEATVDYNTREVFWVHTTLDPETMEMPDDPMAGYLPAIDSTGYQLGWVNYTIKPISGLPDGTVFTNQAFVNFDGVGRWGPAPKEGPYTNIFDVTPPTSFVIDLPLSYDGDSVLVEWEGEDPGCGLINYTIYVSTNGNEYVEWVTTSNKSAWFKGEPGSTYEFYSIATDFVGNAEETKSFAEATIFFNDANGFSRIDGQCISFEVYPNPTSSDAGFTIQFGSNNLLYGGKMQLITTDGRVLFEKLNLNQKMEIKVDRQGIFVLQVVLNNGETLTEKVIVR